MRNKNFFFIVFIFCIYFVPMIVNAEIIEFNICLSGGTYHITYDDSISTEVSKDKINQNAVNNGYVSYPDDISEAEKKKYTFTSHLMSTTCSLDSSGNVLSCPTSNQRSTYDFDVQYLTNSESNISYILNENNGTFTMKIKDKYNGALSIRYVVNSDNLNTSRLPSSVYSNSLIYPKNGYYTISNVPASSVVYLEFYIKKAGTCTGSYLGYVYNFTPEVYEMEIDNPAINDPNGYGCTNVKNYTIPNASTNGFNTYKKNYISECYDAKILYSEKASLKATIARKFAQLKQDFDQYINNSTDYIPSTGATSGGSPSVNTGSFTSSTYNSSCNSTLNLGNGENVIYTNVSTGHNWSIKCTASYKATGDTAKLVHAGNGFGYDTNYQVVRTCTINWIGEKVIKRPKCNYYQETECTWTGQTTGLEFKDEKNCGPNDDFDDCVAECDGGEYTQSCINSCYNRVYGNSRDTSFTEKFSFSSNERAKIKKVASFVPDGDYTMSDIELYYPPGGLFTNEGHKAGYAVINGIITDVKVSTEYCYSDANMKAHIGFKTSCTNCPNCSDDPETEYRNKINKIKSELQQFINLANSAMNSGSYTTNILDSYLVKGNGQAYTYSVSNGSSPNLNVNSSVSTSSYGNKTVQIGDQGDNVLFNSITVKTLTSSTSLPSSYINKVNGNAVYQKGGSTDRAYQVNAKNNRFDSIKFNSKDYYNGGRKYYTSIWSGNINVNVGDTSVSLSHNSNNIKVSSSGVGASPALNNNGFSSDILCYYGVYNNYFNYENDPDIPDPDIPNDGGNISSDPTPGCSDNYCGLDGTGIQYIYRPIDLGDVFPNGRSPRWNWTNSAKRLNDSYLKYNIDPVAVTEHIESLGESIYDVESDSSEIDYEFILTRENINNIRAYNRSVKDYNGDGDRNYADYNMSCYTNSRGRQICTSRFLDNVNGNSGSESSANFISYSVSGFTIDARKNLAGCNNSKNGSCFNISK